MSHTNPTKSLPTMTQKTKDWATRTPLKVYLPWQKTKDWTTRIPLKVYLPWHKTKDWATRTPLKVYLPWQKTKDWTTRTPLRVYQPWHRKLKVLALDTGSVWLCKNQNCMIDNTCSIFMFINRKINHFNSLRCQ